MISQVRRATFRSDGTECALKVTLVSPSKEEARELAEAGELGEVSAEGSSPDSASLRLDSR